ncbi:MAG: tRNA-dihydrouridine synthase family protein [Firmicutes bacterium]|nr:tRNA-dihydrouridine synthase family protein [Bacillota bacterium]
MRYYFAPMEGLTDSVYRRLHHKYFPGVDRYFMPFFSPTVHRQLTARESRELPEADSVSFAAVPQVLTKVPEDFLWAAEVIRDRGYEEVNLNLGCPSGTVTAKGKGAGMLTDPESLDRFLDAVFRKCPIAISVKTRLGMQSPDEFPALLEVFNRYPIRELTLHPRVRQEFYSNDVHMDWFRYALENSKNPLCYNGNLCTLSQLQTFCEQYPQVDTVMLGRGLIGDPGMLSPGGTTVPALEAFFDELLETYTALFGGSRNAMFRLKENWFYLLRRFEDSEKLGKQLRKTTDIAEYKSLTAQIFHTLPLAEALRSDW